MGVQNLVAQDRRQNARIPTCLSCRCAFQGVSREAVILNISLAGALVSANLKPPPGSAVTLTLEPPLLQKPIILEGLVTRDDPSATERGILNRFAVRFTKTSIDLLSLIGKLASQQR